MRKPKLLFSALFLSIFMITTNINSQEVTPGVLISDDNSLEKADESAILDVNSETKGFLPPRLNIKQRDAIEDPAEGLTIFNTTTKKLNYFDGINWIELGESGDSKSTKVDSKNTEKDAKVACEANITVNGTLCDGGVLSLSTPVVTGTNVTYSWIGADGWTSNLREPSRSNMEANMSGLYKVIVAVNGTVCVARDSVMVTIHKNPSISASNTGPYCEGETISLTTSPRFVNGTYSWSGPEGWTSNDGAPTIPLSTTSMSGIYRVTAANQYGCTASAQTEVVVNPGFPRSYMSNITVCWGDAITLNPQTICRGCTYSWSGPNGFTSTATSPQIPNADALRSGTYELTITNMYGCTGQEAINVTVVEKPSSTISGSLLFCQGSTISLSVPLTSNATYSWTGPNNFTSNSNTITRTSATTAMSGIYYVTVTNSSGCSSTSQKSITVNPRPTAHSTNTGPYCAGETINLNTPNVTGATYSWSGPNGWTSTSRTPSIANATASMTGNYYVTVTDQNRCTNSSGSTVTVKTKPASPSADSHSSTDTQITWRWNTASGATGFKWNTTNNYSTAIDKGYVRNHIENGLTCNTTYTRYVWAYNSCGYSATPLIITFTTAPCPSCTGEKVFDIDGNLYLAVQIGEQCWLDRNLKTKRYKDGVSIPYNSSSTSYGETYSWILNDSQLGASYGALYSGAAVQTGKLCPTGWHVPTQAEWQILLNHANSLTGDYSQLAKVLKDPRCGTNYAHPRWNNCPTGGITNSTGFGALAGDRAGVGTASSPGSKAFFSISTPASSSNYQRIVSLSSENNTIYQDIDDVRRRISVRCIKDE